MRSASLWLCAALVLLGGARSEADGTCASVAAAHAQSFDTYTLTYFDGRGLAEVPRTLFATSGHAFNDVRLTRDQFKDARGQGDLAKNLNRVPMLNHNGAIVGQSGAISRYLARQLGLMGSTEIEAAQIDSMTEHVADIKAAYRRLFPYRPAVPLADDELAANKKVWFETPAVPELENRAERQLQWFLGKVEATLPDSGSGYSVGGRPSLADAYIFNLLGEYAPTVEDKTKGEPFGDKTATDAVLAGFPKLKAVVDTFRDSPGMQQYLSTRKVNW